MPEQSYQTQVAVFLDQVRAFERNLGLPENSLASLVLTGIEVFDDIAPITLGDLMEMDLPEAQPTIGHVDMIDKPLFYRGGLNLVFGAPGDGKSMLMQHVALDEARRGNKVLWLDAEEAVWNGVKQRWSALLEGDAPDGLWLTLIDRFSARRRDKLVELVKENDVALVVVDSFGEFLGKTGRAEIDDGDIQSAYDFLMPFAQAGAAVVIIDHPPKADRRSASGSKRKMARPWVTYGTNLDANEEDSAERSFAVEKAGYMRLFCVRDRYGSRPNMSVAARMDVMPTAGHAHIALRANYEDIDEMIEPPVRHPSGPTPEQKVLAYAADGSQVTKRIVKDVAGYSNMDEANALLKRLCDEGKLAYSRLSKTYALPLAVNRL